MLVQTERQLFSGRVAIVTGASSGIGRAIAIALAAEGAAVCAVGRNQNALDETQQKIYEAGGTPYVSQLDLTNDEKVREFASRVHTDFKRLDILIHCAGIMIQQPVGEPNIDDFDMHYRTNLRAPYLLTYLLLPLLIHNHGQIAFINSTLGLAVKTAGVGQYSATKHGLKAVADALREEVNNLGIRVLTVYPGRTASPLQEMVHRVEQKPYCPELLLQPQDVAAVVVRTLALPSTAEVTDITMRSMLKPM
jgi:NAD(P)-dependent dehydrogenase (short-subunit alcohol dehydrogenase family)